MSDTASDAELAAADSEREASVAFLQQFLPVAEAALPDADERDPLRSKARSTVAGCWSIEAIDRRRADRIARSRASM